MHHLTFRKCIHKPNLELKENRSYAQDKMPILETRSEVKVTVTVKWNGTIRHSKMHLHTKFGIPTSNNKRYVLDTNILQTRSEVKVNVTRKWYVKLCNPKWHPHIIFGIPTFNNKRDMRWT